MYLLTIKLGLGAGRRPHSRSGCGWWLFCLGASLAVIPSRGIVARQNPEPWPAIRQPLGQHMSEIVSLRPGEGKLKIEICSAVQPAMEAVRNIASGQGSTASGGGNYWMAVSAGETAAMLAGKGDPYRSNESLPLRVQYSDLQDGGLGTQDGGWRMDLTANDEGGFALLAFSRKSPHLLYFEQTEAGPVRAVGASPDGLTHGQADSFAELVEREPGMTSDLLLPQLRQWGVCRLSGKKSRSIRDLILLVFKPLPADPEWQEVLLQLDSSKFGEREKATEWLERHAADRMSEILAAMRAQQTTSEVVSRLRKVLKSSLPEADYASLEFMESQQLNSDPEYLIWLAEEIEARRDLPEWLADETVRSSTLANVFAQLRELTHQEFGDQSGDWRRWLAGSTTIPVAGAANPAAEVQPAELGSPPAELVRWSADLRNLAPIGLAEGKWKIHRAYWQELYQGKSVMELIGETRNYLQERNLPRTWLAVNPEQEAALDYPQLLFKRLEADVESDPADDRERARRQQILMMSNNVAQRNLRIAAAAWTGTLEIDEGNFLDTYHRSLQRARRRNDAGTEDVMILDFQGNGGAPWRFLYGVWPGGELRVVVVTERDLVHLFQDGTGRCWLDVVANGSPYHAHAETPGLLGVDPVFQRTVQPYLGQIGLEFPVR